MISKLTNDEVFFVSGGEGDDVELTGYTLVWKTIEVSLIAGFALYHAYNGFKGIVKPEKIKGE